MRKGWIIVGGLILAFVILPTVVSASVSASKKNTSWERAVSLGLPGTQAIQYGVLGSVGDARFFSFNVVEPQSLQATVDVPVWADKNFHPQLIIYQPDTVTMGPAVPVVQPPSTLALIYPPTSAVKHFEQKTQISVLERLKTTIEFPVAGKYYLAIYNADHAGGRFRLTLTEPGKSQIQSLWEWPRQWWLAQTWASESFLTAYLPVLLLLVMVGVTWFILRFRRPLQPTHHRKKV